VLCNRELASYLNKAESHSVLSCIYL